MGVTEVALSMVGVLEVTLGAVGVLEAALSAVEVLEVTLGAVGVVKDVTTLGMVGMLEVTVSVVGVPEIALSMVGVLEAAIKPVPIAVTADPALVVVITDPGADPAADPAADPTTEPTALTPQDPEATAIVRGLGLATVKLKVAIKGILNSRLGCPILAPSSTLGPSPFPLDLHLAMGPNI